MKIPQHEHRYSDIKFELQVILHQVQFDEENMAKTLILSETLLQERKTVLLMRLFQMEILSSGNQLET